MNGHDEYLELLAASIDFGLTEEEVARLNYHLASCPECRRAATELRGQNAVIATTPIAPLAPARSEQILRAALRKPATKPRWGMLAVAALLATLGGGVLFAGVQLITDDDPAPDQSPPIVAEVSAPPSELPAEESVDPGAPPPVDGPRVTPNPGDDEPPPPADPAKLAFPLPYTTELGMIRVAPAPDDRLWVSFTRDNETVLALLDAAGAPLEGWPSVVRNAIDCLPLAAPDGSVRLPCYYNEATECSDGSCGESGCSRSAADGQPLAASRSPSRSGLLPGLTSRRTDGRRRLVVLTEYDGSDDEIRVSRMSARLVEVRPDGNIVLGARIPAPDELLLDRPERRRLRLVHCRRGRTGASNPARRIRRQRHAAGLADRRRWKYRLAPVVRSERPARLLVLDRRGFTDCQAQPGWIPGGGIARPHVFHRMVARRRRPTAAPGRRSRASLGGRRRCGSLASTPPTRRYRASRTTPRRTCLLEGTSCGAGDTGCQSWIEPPRLAPRKPDLHAGNRLRRERAGASPSSIATAASAPAGRRPCNGAGAAWDSVTIGENRRAYAVAIEPEPNNESSISVLAFAPNGTREWISVLVEP